MSHSKERKEKICLNCNAEILGRYCHVCGQENLEPKETVWHLVSHFFNDITHFDGKFFSTVKYLITRPGFLSAEYMAGRRASYLNPIRMYVFTSAIFFLILFSLPGADSLMRETNNEREGQKTKTEGIKDWEQKKLDYQKQLKTADIDDSADINGSLAQLDLKIAAVKKMYGDTSTRTFTKTEISMLIVRANMGNMKKSGMPVDIADKVDSALSQTDGKGDTDGLTFFGKKEDRYRTLADYDSIQATLPAREKDGWLKKIFHRKLVAATIEYRKDHKQYFERFKENFFHSFPKILFFSLPFFALILKLVYIRRKNYYYADHGIFTIHVYCATFIFLLILILLNSLSESITWGWYQVLSGLLIFVTWVYMLIYLYKAMRRFYKQRRFKTFCKYVLVCFLAFMVNVFLIVLFVLLSAISVS